MDDTQFNRLLKKYRLSEADYYNKENPLGIAIDKNIEFDRTLEKYVTLDTLLVLFFKVKPEERLS